MGDYSGRGHLSGAWSAHEHPIRRSYRMGRGRTESGYPRGRASQERTFHSPGGVPGPGDGHGLGPLGRPNRLTKMTRFNTFQAEPNKIFRRT